MMPCLNYKVLFSVGRIMAATSRSNVVMCGRKFPGSSMGDRSPHGSTIRKATCTAHSIALAAGMQGEVGTTRIMMLSMLALC